MTIENQSIPLEMEQRFNPLSKKQSHGKTGGDGDEDGGDEKNDILYTCAVLSIIALVLYYIFNY
jgi:hypothetical protein